MVALGLVAEGGIVDEVVDETEANGSEENGSCPLNGSTERERERESKDVREGDETRVRRREKESKVFGRGRREISAYQWFHHY